MKTRDVLTLSAVAVIGVSLISFLTGVDGVKTPGEVQTAGDAWKADHEQNVADHERTIDSIGR